MDYSTQKLLDAIKTMRDFLDDAERSIGDKGRTDIDKANRVAHSLVWGLANAMAQVESCLAGVDRATQMEAMRKESTT